MSSPVGCLLEASHQFKSKTTKSRKIPHCDSGKGGLQIIAVEVQDGSFVFIVQLSKGEVLKIPRQKLIPEKLELVEQFKQYFLHCLNKKYRLIWSLASEDISRAVMMSAIWTESFDFFASGYGNRIAGAFGSIFVTIGDRSLLDISMEVHGL
jgi:hypothetical protein